MLSNLSPNWWQNDVAAVKKKKKNRKKTSWTTAWPFTSTGNKLAPTLDWKGSAMKANCTLLRNKKKVKHALNSQNWRGLMQLMGTKSLQKRPLRLLSTLNSDGLQISFIHSKLSSSARKIWHNDGKGGANTDWDAHKDCMILKRWRTVCRQHLISSHRRAFKPVLHGKILSYIAVIDVMRINFIS